MSLKSLPDVSLCCVDTRTPAMAVRSIRASLAQCDFGRVILFSDHSAENLDLSGIELIKIPPIKTIDQYSHFIIKELGVHVSTSHALIMQWDGYVVDAKQWRDDFLQFDYVGAPWIHGPGKGMVGNGGFSLRSKRLMGLLAQDVFEATNPEDLCICVQHKSRLEQQHQIRFAPAEVARKFSCERGEWNSPFGFHGVFNAPRFMTPNDLTSYVSALPSALCTSKDTRHLIRSLMKASDPENAKHILKKRIQHQGWSRDNIYLWIRISISKWSRWFQ